MASALDECKALLVRRWGEMGGYWGINRTMAEIHALLFVSGHPLCTDDIMRLLHVSRGNASMNLRGLVDWGLIQRVHKLGDRKEYYQADTDVWHMFETIMRERRRREVEPILESIERCRNMVPAPGEGPEGPSAEEVREFSRRLDELQQFLVTMGVLFEMVLRHGNDGVSRLMQTAAPAAAPPPPSEPAAAAAQRTRDKPVSSRTRKAHR
jgi:HTH-type transcriptional regulator, glycine betaine synthesis regulator